jgi:nitrile hydratase accessory protein
MTTPTPILALDVDGPAAPPRSNGELVFAEPWQGRAFGLTMALVDRGAITYDAFRERLIAGISTWERTHPEGTDFSYYRCWLAALEQELADHQLVDADDLAARSAEFAVRPAGHDHDHDHAHDLSHAHDEDRAHGHA